MTAFSTANILIPRLNAAGMSKWSVVACDQYTGEPQYWKETADIVGDAPSALKLILPEVYLEQPDTEQRISAINAEMEKYSAQGLFEEYPQSLILTRRTQADGKVRTGIVGAIDLEMYDYNKGSRSQVRATEATVAARIPPRVKIRKDAALELPHIMILIDDPAKTVIEPLEEKAGSFKKVYDFELMQNGGHLEGFAVDGGAAAEVLAALDRLSDRAEFNRRYGLNNEEVLLYAMGDGNHSLATAKECYEMKKREGSPDAQLARYALVELVNLHSPALEFEAIHRVVIETDTDRLMRELTAALGLTRDGEGQRFTVILNGEEESFVVTKPTSNLTVGSLQGFLDGYLAENAGKIDYIHGEDVVRSLCGQSGSIGFLLPSIEKSELFPTVIKDGALPRKTFSMGHANDKRFYCEARRIKG
ncbi:MAG: DUF1015 domain-containing protein [Oscillospiraceae bacterium]|nr:DUF1015 domain-containing protein [Oscillospiraceae bacterium]